jgi:hypothetical protein
LEQFHQNAKDDSLVNVPGHATAIARSFCAKRSWVFLLALTWAIQPSLAGRKFDQSSLLAGYTYDKSDWWSQLGRDDANRGVTVQKREPAVSNFRILGIDLGDDDTLGKAAAKLGEAQSVQRGDASTGRSQICYASVRDRPKRIHLVFESGDVSDWFYLFADGPDWKGSDLCVKSNLVTENVSVASGLRLGQAPAEVKAILGKPSAVIGNKIIYSFAFEKKTSLSDFDKLRRQHPELSEEDLHRDYEFYSIGVYIEARFTQSRLSYLAVSKAETY